ncbi:class I SAM-dependent methyltransferase [Deinococcus hopiensis]|uniref:Methylase involved in ubiquinone/menaquinone biosynthesis n=1 Tax=Deinococcus hopiensis KR-140 TaxID=695939 RepID=A0A1W1UQI4_9DEIO|nr:class I SAM-dependent methyltransferase [Deinococcus hopiensis]SMB82964.1 Methylase involved in ubiquinone/menaquinone biosynthesis [Deinococcus hopiensis KR-140]
MTQDNRKGLWSTADAYEQYMGRWSRDVAPLFLKWLTPEMGRDWVDLGCGTGALTSGVTQLCQPERVVGVDTSEAFIQRARSLVSKATFEVGDATDSRLPAASFDYAVSGLVLNFTRDPSLMLREMTRLVRPGGQVALYVWDYAGHMQIMRHFFEAARTVDPHAATYDDGINAPICRPEALRSALQEVGLSSVNVTSLDVPAAFENFEAYWTPFLGGAGSAPRYVATLDAETRDRIREAIRDRLPTGPDGEILMALRAWGVRGTVT